MKNENAGSKNLIRAMSLEWIPFLLIILFAYTGASKLVDHAHFLQQLKKMVILKDYAVFTSFFIPVVELLTALALVFHSFRIPGLIASASLMLLFTLYVVFVLSGSNLPCSCGGVISAMSWQQHLYFNVVFFIFSLTSLLYYISLRVYKGVS